MKKIAITSALIFGLATSIFAQEKVWTLEECMIYAIENSPKVKQKRYETANYQEDYNRSIADVLPNISASSSANFYVGRSTDDENRTINQSSFQNNYNLSASIPIFKGGYYINQWKQAQIGKVLGKNNEELEEDEVSLRVMEAFMNVLYYSGTVVYAAETLEESTQNLHKTKRMEELGLKSYADVAQIEAQVAENDYTLTNQQNLYNSAILTLKELMNYPYDEELFVNTNLSFDNYLIPNENILEIFDYAKINNPQAKKAELNLQYTKYQHKLWKSYLLPDISFGFGVGSDYRKALNPDKSAADYIAPLSFKDQLSGKRSESYSFSIRFPIFNGLYYISNIRKAKNNVRISALQQAETLRNLQTLIEQNVLDREGFAKEIVQMERKVNADDIAYQVMLRKFEEGLSSSLDLQTTANTLLNSKATLLLKRLNFIQKDKLVNYYKGIPLIEE